MCRCQLRERLSWGDKRGQEEFILAHGAGPLTRSAMNLRFTFPALLLLNAAYAATYKDFLCHITGLSIPGNVTNKEACFAFLYYRQFTNATATYKVSRHNATHFVIYGTVIDGVATYTGKLQEGYAKLAQDRLEVLEEICKDYEADKFCDTEFLYGEIFQRVDDAFGGPRYISDGNSSQASGASAQSRVCDEAVLHEPEIVEQGMGKHKMWLAAVSNALSACGQPQRPARNIPKMATHANEITF